MCDVLIENVIELQTIFSLIEASDYGDQMKDQLKKYMIDIIDIVIDKGFKLEDFSIQDETTDDSEDDGEIIDWDDS